MMTSANQNPVGGHGDRRPVPCPASNLQCDFGPSVSPRPHPQSPASSVLKGAEPGMLPLQLSHSEARGSLTSLTPAEGLSTHQE